MNTKKILALVVALAMVAAMMPGLGIVASAADVTTYAVTNDSFVQVFEYGGGGPDVNFNGDSNGLYISHSGWGNHRMSFVQFDISNVNPAAVVKATLNVTPRTGDNGTSTVYSLTGTFDETTLTYNNKPGRGSNLGTIKGGGQNNLVSLDITNYIKSVVSENGTATAGFEFANNSGNLFLYTKEQDASKAAYITIETSAVSDVAIKFVDENGNAMPGMESKNLTLAAGAELNLNSEDIAPHFVKTADGKFYARKDYAPYTVLEGDQTVAVEYQEADEVAAAKTAGLEWFAAEFTMGGTGFGYADIEIKDQSGISFTDFVYAGENDGIYPEDRGGKDPVKENVKIRGTHWTSGTTKMRVAVRKTGSNSYNVRYTLIDAQGHSGEYLVGDFDYEGTVNGIAEASAWVKTNGGATPAYTDATYYGVVPESAVELTVKGVDENGTTLVDFGVVTVMSGEEYTFATAPATIESADRTKFYTLAGTTTIVGVAEDNNVLNIVYSPIEFKAVAAPSAIEVGGQKYNVIGENVVPNPSFETAAGDFSLKGWYSAETGETFGRDSTADHSFKINKEKYWYLSENITTGGTAYTDTYTPHDGEWALGSRWNDNENGLCSIRNNFFVGANKTVYLSFWTKATTGDDAVLDWGIANDVKAGRSANIKGRLQYDNADYANWKKVEAIVTTDADNPYVQFNAYWLGESTKGAQPYFLFDEFVVAEVAEDNFGKIPVTVDLKCDGETVAEYNAGESYAGETVTVPAGIYGGQYYLDAAAVSTEIDSTGKATAEVKKLQYFTWEKSSNSALQTNATYNAARAVYWGSGSGNRTGYAYAEVPAVNEDQELNLVFDAVLNNGYDRNNVPVAVFSTVDVESLKAIDLAGGEATTAALDALEATEIAREDIYVVIGGNGNTDKVTEPDGKEYTHAVVSIPVTGELAVGEVAIKVVDDGKQAGIAVIKNVRFEAVAKHYETTISYKLGDEVLDSVTERLIGEETISVPARTFYRDGVIYNLPEVVAKAGETKTSDAVADTAKTAITFDGHMSPNGSSSAWEIWGSHSLDSNGMEITGYPTFSDKIAVDGDGVSTKGTSVNAVKSRLGVISFPVPADYEQGKTVTLNLFMNASHKQNHGVRLAVVASDVDTDRFTEDGDKTAMTVDEIFATWNGIVSYSDTINSKHNSNDSGSYIAEEAAWLTVDVTEAVAAAKNGKVSFFLVMPSGCMKVADTEKSGFGGEFEGKAAYLTVSDGVAVSATGASYVTKNGSKVMGDAVTAKVGDTVRAYDAEGNRMLVDNALTTTVEGALAATAKAVNGSVSVELGYDDNETTDAADDVLLIVFKAAGLEGLTAKVSSALAAVQDVTLVEDAVIAVAPKNANVPYTVNVVDKNGEALGISASAALYPLVTADIAKNLEAYTAGGALSRIAQAVDVLTAGGVVGYGADGKFGDSRDAFITVSVEEEATTISIADGLYINGFGFKVGTMAGPNAVASTGEEGVVYQTIVVAGDTVTVQGVSGTAVFSLEEVEIEFVEPTEVEVEISSDVELGLDFTQAM